MAVQPGLHPDRGHADIRFGEPAAFVGETLVPDRAHAVLIRRLEQVGRLDEDDRNGIRALPVVVRQFGGGEDIVSEGERVEQCCVLIDGFTYRYKMMRDGRRQIIAFHVGGDIPDLHSLHINTLDHSFATTAPSQIGFVKHSDIWALCVARPNVASLLWLETLIDGAIFREWIVGLGRRSARSRTAHLLCEIAIRLRAVGLAPDFVYRLPLTQNELADALGLTVVTVNRVLQSFRQEGLIERERSRMAILNWPALSKIAEFDTAYLHFRTSVRMDKD